VSGKDAWMFLRLKQTNALTLVDPIVFGCLVKFTILLASVSQTILCIETKQKTFGSWTFPQNPINPTINWTLLMTLFLLFALLTLTPLVNFIAHYINALQFFCHGAFYDILEPSIHHQSLWLGRVSNTDTLQSHLQVTKSTSDKNFQTFRWHLRPSFKCLLQFHMWRLVTWKQICASLNHCIKMEAEPSQLIPQKLLSKLELPVAYYN